MDLGRYWGPLGLSAIPVCFSRDWKFGRSAAQAHKMCIAPSGQTMFAKVPGVSEIFAEFSQNQDARTILDGF